MHVIHLKDHGLEQQNHSVQLACQVVIPELMLFDYLELFRIFQILAALYACLQRNRNFLLDCVVYHVAKLFFGLDLLIEHAKGDVFEVS